MCDDEAKGGGDCLSKCDTDADCSAPGEVCVPTSADFGVCQASGTTGGSTGGTTGGSSDFSTGLQDSRQLGSLSQSEWTQAGEMPSLQDPTGALPGEGDDGNLRIHADIRREHARIRHVQPLDDVVLEVQPHHVVGRLAAHAAGAE